MQLLSLLCSATMDEGKREINIISSVGYFLCIYEFFFLLSAHVLLFFIYSILLSIYEARCGVRLFYIWPLKYKEAIYEVHMIQINTFSFFYEFFNFSTYLDCIF